MENMSKPTETNKDVETKKVEDAVPPKVEPKVQAGGSKSVSGEAKKAEEGKPSPDQAKESKPSSDQAKESKPSSDQAKESKPSSDQAKESKPSSDQAKEGNTSTNQAKEAKPSPNQANQGASSSSSNEGAGPSGQQPGPEEAFEPSLGGLMLDHLHEDPDMLNFMAHTLAQEISDKSHQHMPADLRKRHLEGLTKAIKLVFGSPLGPCSVSAAQPPPPPPSSSSSSSSSSSEKSTKPKASEGGEASEEKKPSEEKKDSSSK